ncbi:DUF4251 domain-containing protein [Kaistella montana]|uniref:DUF4251 domain-containing protein n=1 Tax=Kaistella montana TaxID=1849733 RepID=A0ABW5K9M6_9FLAO|nr:DUF4251 domain-containing protein [Kaistella montana]MCQ4035685.1 DUF4251 domain-containing protein [Kaistella montana]
MKNLFQTLIFGILIFVLNACSSTNSVSNANITKLLKDGEFTFMAQRANPTSSDVVNVLNSFPNSSSSQVLNLDYGYSLKITKDELVAELPYFGRMFSSNYDNTKNSYRFTSKDFNISESSGKKGSTIYTINAKDQQNIRRMILEVFANGKAYLSIDSSDRQPISYDGYIKENSK